MLLSYRNGNQLIGLYMMETLGINKQINWTLITPNNLIFPKNVC